MNNISIYFDGGCRPTNPGNKYGSYEVILNGRQLHRISELELGRGTNNEAEFEILIEALKWTVDAIRAFGNEPIDFDLELFSDSTVVINRLAGRFSKVKTEPQQRMAARANECLKRLILFRSFKAKWRGRESNVKRFGH